MCKQTKKESFVCAPTDVNVRGVEGGGRGVGVSRYGAFDIFEGFVSDCLPLGQKHWSNPGNFVGFSLSST